MAGGSGAPVGGSTGEKEALGGREAEIEAALRYLAYGLEAMADGSVRVLQGPQAITADGLLDARAALDALRSSCSAAQNQEAARVVCSWCEGTGWVCDGCGRPEKLCMASACGGAALSMSGCPKCYRGGCGGSGYVEVRSSGSAARSEECTCAPTTGTDYEPHDPSCPKSARSSGSAAQNQEGPPPIEEDAGYWRKMYEELHSITAGDPTSIYHEHEQLRRRIVELEAARSPQDENYEAGIYAAGRALAVIGGDEELYDRGDPIAMEWRDEARAAVDAYLSRCSQGIEAQRWRLALREIAKYDSATAAGQDLVQYLVGIAREALAEFSVPPAGTPDDKEQP